MSAYVSLGVRGQVAQQTRFVPFMPARFVNKTQVDFYQKLFRSKAFKKN